MKIRKILGVITISAFLFFIVSCNQNIEFTVIFDSNGGTTVSPITTDGKSTIKTPDDPTKDGFEFGGWYWDNHTFSRPFTANSLLDAPISSNMTVYAKWILDNDPPIGTISVTFVTNGGTNVPIQNVLPGSKLSIPQIQREGYTLDGWYTSLNEGETLDERWSFANNTVDNQLVLYANWIINHYTITFKNHDGTVLATDEEVEWGSTPSYGGATPTKAATAEFTYSFSGWSPEIGIVTTDVEYIAQYNASINSYEVIWKNYDGTVLEIDNVLYGQLPSYDGEIPSKPATQQYNYTFSGWEPSIDEVTEDIEYVVQFTETVNLYKVIFLDWNGEVLKSESIAYGSEAIAPTDPKNKEGYHFVSWNQEFDNIIDYLEVTAVYTINLYKVTWNNDDGSILETDDDVEWGSTPSYGGATPTKAATAEFTYSFSGWSPEIGIVTTDVEYIAQYNASINSYEVIWKNYDGTVLEIDNVLYGQLPSYDGEIPSKPATQQYNYTFSGWEPSIDEVTEDIEYVVQFTETVNLYKVIFLDWNGEVLKSESIAYGSEAIAPTDPKNKEGYHFVSWNQEFDNIIDYLEVTAVYTINLYKVTWNNDDGSILETDDDVEWGSTPSYGGATPTKAATAEFTYSFSGWSPEIGIVTTDVEYIAQYNASINSYEVIWKNYDGTVLEIDNVLYGQLPSYDGEIPSKPATQQYDYIFSGWEPNINEVTEDIEYVAFFCSELDTPTNISINNGLLLWESVQNASSYKIIIGENEYLTDTNSFNLILFNTIDIKVIAIGSGYYLNSKEVNLYYIENGITYINYGTYPQTVVSDTNTIQALNNIILVNDKGYYEYNGNEYAKIIASPQLGHYFINGSSIIYGKTYYFIVEPIKWRVISNNEGVIQLLSEYIIDSQKYCSSSDERIIDGNIVYANNYEYSDIRSWLNNVFYNQAFGSIDQAIIITTEVNNGESSTYSSSNSYASNNTQDKIYLLSYQDVYVNKYGFSDGKSRIAQPTDYARAIGTLMNNTYGNGYWWLRSPDSTNGRFVNTVSGMDGYMSNFFTYGDSIGTRPSLQII